MSGERLSSHPNDIEREAAQRAYEAWAANETGHNQPLTSSIGEVMQAKLRQVEREEVSETAVEATDLSTSEKAKKFADDIREYEARQRRAYKAQQSKLEERLKRRAAIAMAKERWGIPPGTEAWLKATPSQRSNVMYTAAYDKVDWPKYIAKVVNQSENGSKNEGSNAVVNVAYMPKIKTGEIVVEGGNYGKAASNPAEVLTKAGVTPQGAVDREVKKTTGVSTEAPTEAPAEAPAQSGQLSELTRVGREPNRLNSSIDERVREQELEKATSSVYDSMPEKLQREMNARGRRHAMAEFGLGSDRKVAKLSKTDHARYQRFLDRASQLTYQAANEYKQRLVHVDQVMSEMGVDEDAKLSDLTADKQIELARKVSHARSEQSRPSEHRGIEDEVDQIMKEIHQKVETSEPRVRVAPLDPNKQSTTEPQVRVVPLDPNAQPAQQQSDAKDSRAKSEPKPEPPVIASESINFNPMVAISIDREQMADDAAQQDARERLNRELSTEYWTERDENGKPIHRFGRIKAVATRLWKGNIWRGYYERKYQRLEREKYQGIESLDMKGKDGKPLSNEELLEKAKTDARYALILRMGQDNERYIYSRAGETREQLGEDDEAYVAMTKALRDFVTRDKDGQWLMDSDALNEELNRIRAMQHDIDLASGLSQKEFKKLAVLDNYEAIAMYVRGQVEHGEAIDDVLQGFRMYEAESREGARTEAYQTLVEDTIDRFQHSKAGRFIPAEWVATAAGAAGWLVGALAKNKAVQFASLGGSAALAGVVAAVKESNAVKIDRTTMARQLATGAVDDSGIEQKYSDEIQLSMYNMVRADQLIVEIDQARESGDLGEMKKALDEVILRQAISDSDGIDLIRYSSSEAVESERVALLTHQLQLEADYITAARQRDPNFDFDDYRERLLSIVDQMPAVNDDVPIDRSGRDFTRTMLIESGAATPEEVLERGERKLSNLSAVPSEQLAKIYDDIRERDKVFARLKRRRVFWAGVKTAAVSAAFSAGFQEVVAYTNDNIRGVLEGISGQNADATSTTTLEGLRSHVADMFGLEQAADVASEVTVGTTQHIAPSGVSEEQLQEWRDKGYDVQPKYAMVNELQTKTVSASEAVQDNARVSRAGWFDNGTRVSDLGELSGHNTGSGYVYNIAGQYSSSNGLSVSGEQMLQTAQNGNLKLLISPTSSTQMNPFEITGHVEGSQVIFDVTPGSPEAQMLADGSFHTAEVFDASNNMVLATEVGSGTADNLTTTVTEAVNQVVRYDVTAPELANDVISIPGVVEIEPPLPFVYPPAGHSVIQTLTYNSPSYITQAPPSINPTLTPWEMTLNRLRQTKVGKFVEDTAKDKIEDAAQSAITGTVNYLADLGEEIPALNAEMTVDMINESLGEFRTEFGSANLRDALGDFLTTSNGHLILSPKAEQIIADNISTFNDDVMRQRSLRANAYLRSNPVEDSRTRDAVYRAALVWATDDVLRQYMGGS